LARQLQNIRREALRLHFLDVNHGGWQNPEIVKGLQATFEAWYELRKGQPIMGMLPTEKSTVKRDLKDMIVLLYGPAKVGKSTFANEAPGAIFLATEPGLNQIECYKITTQGADCCTSWEDVQQGVKELMKHAKETKAIDDAFGTVVIDTVEELCDLAAIYVVEQHNRKADRKAEHISDIGYGKGYAALWQEVKRCINTIARSRYGLFLIAHSHEITKEDATGEYTVTVPNLSGRLKNNIEALADLILYTDIQTKDDKSEERVVFTKPSKYHCAGDRTAMLPAKMPLDYSAFEDVLKDQVRAFATEAWQYAGKHPALEEKEARQAAMNAVIEVVTAKKTTQFNYEGVKALTDEQRDEFMKRVKEETDEALKAHQKATEAKEGEGAQDNQAEDESASEAKPGAKKGGKKGSKKPSSDNEAHDAAYDGPDYDGDEDGMQKDEGFNEDGTF